MHSSADLSRLARLGTIAVGVIALLTACTPTGKTRFSSLIYHNKSGVSVPHDAQGGITVRVKLYAGEALTVKTGEYSFIPGRGGKGGAVRRGSGSFTFTEEGLLQATHYFVLKNKRYSGALEARRDHGAWLYINHVSMDEYLTSVVSHEMSPTWHAEALKAQAVVSRTYLLTKMKDRAAKPYDVDTTTNYQVYGGLKKNDGGARNAVAATHNEVLYYGANLAQTYFHSSCGGTLASAKEVWGKAVPYLTTRTSPYCASAPVYKWQVKISYTDIGRRLALRGVKSVTVAERSASKRVKTLKVVTTKGTKLVRADKFRTMLGALKVKSTFFGVARKGNAIVLTGRGFGHGVGMCQWGAKLEADERGTDYRRILEHYFPGTSLRAVDAQSV